MSDANVQVVKEIYERFRAGDGEGFLALLSDDVVWDHRGPDGPAFNKLYEGKAAVGEFLGELGAAEEALVLEDREYFTSGDRVVVLGFMRFRALATGKEWESDWAMAMTVRDGLVTHWRILFDMGREADALRG
ncbi:MAG: hypothetical protein CL483_08070 [Acidobacteria bacterium]|jgi:ketosteroid isomerase-like protein|nr:hypothetical protein [Acidobacteriota bacterium]|tara:strand:- start:70 stop:468 length:399 start_codon:yes stop_codon:yes gene_type:complete